MAARWASHNNIAIAVSLIAGIGGAPKQVQVQPPAGSPVGNRGRGKPVGCRLIVLAWFGVVVGSELAADWALRKVILYFA
jgi:hypothetical protein